MRENPEEAVNTFWVFILYYSQKEISISKDYIHHTKQSLFASKTLIKLSETVCDKCTR